MLNVYYKNVKLKKYYRPDLYVSGGIVVELKAVPCITGTEEAQLLNYLKATGMDVGYIINWGNCDKLEWKRYVYSH